MSKTDNRGIATSYQYDALNRLTQKSYGDGTASVAYSYDTDMSGGNGGPNYPVGRLSQVTMHGAKWPVWMMKSNRDNKIRMCREVLHNLPLLSPPV